MSKMMVIENEKQIRDSKTENIPFFLSKDPNCEVVQIPTALHTQQLLTENKRLFSKLRRR
ncbi:hypothetical protein AT268_32190 [Bacillus cereus]|uniref:Uncharacterized protein n=1 Tax=Bacillus cereus TaxID=1396 RepID=A0A9X0MJU4_BACCE|nr:hypothetical protein [Bacillus cereus]KXY51162.1 hypothetical protein AT268_32190 [Bacillus cereus]